MAKVKFETFGKSDNVSIYLRLTIGVGKQFRRKTGYNINPVNWSTSTKLPKPNDEHLKNLKTSLMDLGNDIEKRCNDAVKNNITIDGEWLQQQIDTINGKGNKDESDRLVNHFQSYIDYLPHKEREGKNKRPISTATIDKYKAIQNKIIAFEKYRKKKILVKDVNLKFRKEFINYLTSVEKLSQNTTGRYITFIKTVCRDAKIYEIETHSQLDAFKGYEEDTAKIYFTFDELEKIEGATIMHDGLINARDWLIIGCYIGQRVSDLLVLTKENIIHKIGLDLIELQQKKTGKNILIPINQKVKEILDKRNGEFPRKISAAKFNIHIKKVVQMAGIDIPTKGAIMQEVIINDKKEFRKLEGTFPKYELTTSHICRRSFASNYYGEMPTSLIISITGHSTESQFLEYVGKPPIDHALKIAEYLNMIYQQQQNKPKLELLKAN